MQKKEQAVFGWSVLTAVCRSLTVPIAFAMACGLWVAPASAAVFDADLDGIVDTLDIDDDNDGIPDSLEITESGADRDSDGDGMPDRLDLDSDNDGILDLAESGVFMLASYPSVRVVAGRLRVPVGENGYADFLETSADSRQMVYSLLNLDAATGDLLPDYLDLDSDNDGLLDLWEAGIPLSLDSDSDGRIDAPPGSVGADGILDLVQSVNDATCCDYDLDGIQDQIPRNTDGGDLPDFQDIDSDNDGVYDVVEGGSADVDGDGRIDGFLDNPANPDGVDDAVLIVPITPPDSNNNGVADVLEFDVQPSTSVPEPVVITPPVADPPVAEPDPVPEPEPVPEPDSGAGEPVVPIPTLPDPTEPQNDGMPVTGDQPLDDDPLVPIQTGLNGGSGCSVTSHRTNQLDPVLPLMLLVSGCWLYRVRYQRTQCKS